MLRKVAGFVRGFAFGLLIGGSAGVLLAPERVEETLSPIESRIEAARTAYKHGRAQAEQELLKYFEQARNPAQEDEDRNMPPH